MVRPGYHQLSKEEKMNQTSHDEPFDVVEASISELREALDAGVLTCVDLVTEYLNRIAYYDRRGLRLNAVPVLNDDVYAEAEAADRRRARGEVLSPLDGIPYTAKASYKAKGMAVSAGSPAFEHLIANDDAFTIERLRAAGAVLVGLTNMPPMANGGMHRGVYGRAESPYNPTYLAAAYGSGSSNGSGVSVAASMAAFGLGEETWSSGRAPASNNALVAYTPSRGVISMRGNWPLFPTMDVVVPHTRTVPDMLELLNQIVADDTDSTGDFWRAQKHVPLPFASEVRPDDFNSLADPNVLRGKRLGVPKMYINRDPDNAISIQTRASVLDLWESARKELEALGAEVVEVDFPAVSNYDQDRPGAQSMVARGLVPKEFEDVEQGPLVACAWQEFLTANGQDGLDSFKTVEPRMVFPLPPGSLRDPYDESGDTAHIAQWAKDNDIALDDIPHLGEALRGLETVRKIDLEDWLDALGIDALVFPTNADVAPHDADFNPVAAEVAWRYGVRYSNGNAAIRHLGIPTVTVPMGVMSDIGMPVGLTFAGRAYSDSLLLSLGFAFEHASPRREAPPLTPALTVEDLGVEPPLRRPPTARNASAPYLVIDTEVAPQDDHGQVLITVHGLAQSDIGIGRVDVFVNGEAIGVEVSGDGRFTARVKVNSLDQAHLHSHWRGPYGALVVVTARDTSGTVAGRFDSAGGI